jgi:hypothetical protein
MKPEMRRDLAQLPFEEKIRKVGELIGLSLKLNRTASCDDEETLLASLDQAAAELDAGKGIPIERVREEVRQGPKKSKK